MVNGNLQKIYADSTKKRTAQQTKWERAVEGLTFDRLEKKKIEYLSPDKKWFLFLQGVYRDHIERMAQMESFALTQEFCLILTIRDPNQKEHVYDEVTQKLDEYNFWHSNIRVATDVNIPL